MGDLIAGLTGLFVVVAYWLGMIGVVLMGLDYLFN
jgi:hypothetical protein